MPGDASRTFWEPDPEDLEKEVFSELFLSWRQQSDEYKQYMYLYTIENEINEMDYRVPTTLSLCCL